ncbi:MAG: GHKL domain-containing protein [Clostridia bacterium]|nr:GHKL domain-containing protein [Clostridia bacterium]
MTLLYNLLLHTLSSAIQIHIAYSFFATYFIKKNNRKLSLLTLSLTLAAFVVTLTFFFESVLLRLIVSIVTLVAVSVLFRMKWYYHAIMPIALYALLAISENLTCALITILFNIDMNTSVTGKYFVIGLFLSKLISFIIVKILYLTKYRFTRIRIGKGILAAVIVPLSTMAVILLQYNFIINTDEISMPVSFLSLFCYASLVTSNFLVFDWINNVAENVEKDTKLAAANELVSIQQESYRSMLEHNRSIQKLKHDQKNLIIGLLGELENENYTEVERSLREELAILDESAAPLFSDGILSAIIQHKSTLARSMGIHLDATVSGIGNVHIPSVDLSIILGNALDNAIEAAAKVEDKERKTISLLLKIVRGTVVIIIKNPTKDHVDTSSLSSTKEDPSSHGFGIYSMKTIAEKYCGEVIFSYSDYTFTTHIVLRNSEMII